VKTDCNQSEFELQGIDGKSIVIKKDGAAISSDGGLILLSLIESKYRIISRLAGAFHDLRNQKLITHTLITILSQRIFGLCQGYEDINDHDDWRLDPLLAIACGKIPDDDGLAGKSTLNRLELGATPTTAKSRYKNIRYDDPVLRKLLVELFLDTFPCGTRGPREIVIDVDSTDDPLHGNQEGRYFHGYYDEYCYLPLYLFVGEFPLWAELRTADIDPAEGVVPALEEIVGEIRKRWKRTRIILRGDSGFNRPDILDWCESQDRVFYVIGLPKNKRLIRAVNGSIRQAAMLFKQTGTSCRIFRDIRYKTKKTWEKTRRVVAKAEHLSEGANPRFIVTNLDIKSWGARKLYEDLYCARGNMENRIKEQKLFMFADRLSSHTIRANQLRLWFSTFAFLFTIFLRNQKVDDPTLPSAQASTIRLKLLKVAARVSVSVRRVVIHIPEAFPYWETWLGIRERLLI
jgi:hypothetical protein